MIRHISSVSYSYCTYKTSSTACKASHLAGGPVAVAKLQLFAGARHDNDERGLAEEERILRFLQLPFQVGDGLRKTGYLVLVVEQQHLVDHEGPIGPEAAQQDRWRPMCVSGMHT